MAARPQVTITLGRSGQVVKRAGTTVDGNQSDYAPSPSLGGKRPIRERLGGNVEDPRAFASQSRSKRQRREGHDWMSDDDLDDGQQNAPKRWIGRDDLRHKLLNKSLHRRGNVRGAEGHVDLRVKLSRNAKISSRHEQQQRQESKPSAPMRQIIPTRSADDLLQLNSVQKSYLGWPLEGRRHRSPDRLIGVSRGPNNHDGLRHVSSRPVGTSRPSAYASKDLFDASRPMPFLTKPSVAIEAPKQVLRVPPPSGIIQKTSQMSEEPITVSGLLRSLGLEKYAILFQAEEVTSMPTAQL